MTVAPDIHAAERPALDWYARARPLCLARLKESRDPTTGLFSRQLRNGGWCPTLDTEAVTSTAICLIALSRADAGIISHEEMKDSLQALATEVRTTGYPGALGVALWANAVTDGVDLGRFLEACGVAEDDLGAVMRTDNSMELSWLLSGLLHERLRAPAPLLDRLCREAQGALLARQRPTGLFMHGGREAKLVQRIRRHVATFADQIYSVLALAHAAIALGEEHRLPACLCADALLARQGPLHQWWWHYKPDAGTVSRHYPAYAVHQYGMAPMAFLTLAAAGAGGYRRHAWSGLEWIGANELGRNLLDPIAGTIWRDVHIERGRIGVWLRNAGEIAGFAADESTESGLALNRETRPYEWAWCLMAEALFMSSPPPGHLA